jgi:hypothetical protein
MALRGTVLDPSICRDYKGKWPLLTVETGAKWGLKENLEGVLPCLICLACPVSCLYKRFFSCLGCSSEPSTKICFPSLYTISLHLSRLPKNLGRQLCRVACLLICVSVVKPKQSNDGQFSGSWQLLLFLEIIIWTPAPSIFWVSELWNIIFWVREPWFTETLETANWLA